MTSAVPTDTKWTRLSWWWLIPLAPLLVFSNGRWQLAVAALVSPFIARLFIFSQPVVRGLLVLLLLQVGASLVTWWEVIPAPGVLYYIIAAAYGLCYSLPFAVDRVLSVRIAGFASTLVLPLSWYGVELLIQWLTPYGSWSSAGYTQMGHGLLTPLAAWLGVSGVAFATIWVASVAAWLVMTNTPVKNRVFASALWAGSMVAIVMLARLSTASESSSMKALPVAAITPSYALTRDLDRSVGAVMQGGDSGSESFARIERLVSELNAELIERSRNAARAGARLVVWSETAGRVLDSEKDDLVAQGQALAREEGIYLFMAIGVWHPATQPPRENKVIAITPSGEVAWQYQKARPIVGAEAHLILPAHDLLPTLDTPFGRIGLVICHDLDFAEHVAQAGRMQVDLMLVPSADWNVIADLHAKMGIMRAIENGFWLFRPAFAGLSVIASPAGRVTHADYDADLDERIFSGEIQVMRSDTIYPHIRSYLPFVAIILFAGLLLLASRGNSP